MDELRNVIANAEELLRVTADQAGPKVQEVRARAEESLRAAREQLQGAGKQIDTHVRENPWAAVGVAAAIGLLAGILLSRK
jgi:ElaB/YqjD/DUF883 family membrane-anchored ribosome-binding protein